MIDIKDATMQELMDELCSRVAWIVACFELPTNEREFEELWKGTYIEKAGAIQALNSKLKYHELMCYKDRFQNDPDEYFGRDDEDE